jgi:hypothetical protein
LVLRYRLEETVWCIVVYSAFHRVYLPGKAGRLNSKGTRGDEEEMPEAKEDDDMPARCCCCCCCCLYNPARHTSSYYWYGYIEWKDGARERQLLRAMNMKRS